jgi:hypothetical protein
MILNMASIAATCGLSDRFLLDDQENCTDDDAFSCQEID